MPKFTASDFNNAQSQSGVVHENTNHTSHTDASKLEQGYQISTPLFGSDLFTYWPLQETSGTTAYDFSGNNNNATSNNGAGPGGTGTPSSPLSTTGWAFDGVDDYVNTGVSINPLTEISVVGWVYDNGYATSSRHRLFGAYDGSNAFNISWRNSPYIEFYTFSGSRNGVSNYTYSFPQNTWTHVAFVFDSSTGYHIYINGTQLTSSTDTNFTPPSNTIYMGAHNSNGSVQHYMDGTLSTMSIYNTSLSQSQVQQMYNVVNTSGTLQTQYKSV